jgi:hypothetical protein
MPAGCIAASASAPSGQRNNAAWMLSSGSIIASVRRLSVSTAGSLYLGEVT